jgi:hypothetical protein
MNDPRDIPAREHPTAGGAPQGAPSAPESAERPQPWHEADESPPPSANRGSKGGGAPIGTHSLTGGGAAVGMPGQPQDTPDAVRSEPREVPPGPDKPDLLSEPRAGTGDLLGR